MKKQPAAAPRYLRPLILALSAFALMGWFSTELSDPDTWWLLKSGQYIWQNHKLPVPDPFAYTTYMGKLAFPGEEHMRDFDLTHERLSEVVFYLVYAGGGFAGLVAFHRSKGYYRALGAAFLAASIADKFRSDRPFLIGFLLLALVMTALEYRRWLWWLPPLFAVWANLHGGFFLGWALLGAYCAEALFLRWRGRPVADERRLWLVSAACVLASGLNPNGFRAATISPRSRACGRTPKPWKLAGNSWRASWRDGWWPALPITPRFRTLTATASKSATWVKCRSAGMARLAVTVRRIHSDRDIRFFWYTGAGWRQ